MAKEVRRPFLILLACALVFLIGFRSGEIYNRMKKKTERIVIVQGDIKQRFYYLVQGKPPRLGLDVVDERDVRMKFFLQRKMRHFLRLNRIKIYSKRGVRIY